MGKIKHFEATEETHLMAKEAAARVEMSLKDYVRLCIVSCKSDTGVRYLTEKEKHGKIMKLFGFKETYKREDIISTAFIDIYDYMINLKISS